VILLLSPGPGVDVKYIVYSIANNFSLQKNAVECISLLVEDYQCRPAIKQLNGKLWLWLINNA
jgi:hypothetical protein